jgi:REP element-mobilizing transposase RayT
MSFYNRNLPHWHPEGAAVFITWRLQGSMPSGWQAKEGLTAGKNFREMDKLLDAASSGPVWLKDTRVARMVVCALHQGDADARYRLHAYVVMSNHVHVLLEPLTPVPRLTNWIKGVTARQANQLLGLRAGPFWQHESYDRWARTPDEFNRIVKYIESNPVLAGLVSHPEGWPWSSASAHRASPGAAT